MFGFAIILPLLAALLILIFRCWRAALAIAGGAASLMFAGFNFFQVQGSQNIDLTYPGLPQLPIRFLADDFSSQLALVVALVATCIFIYARGYFEEEKNKTQFWAGISLFLASMQTLVFSNDWFSFITAWELMGFASWLLIATHFRESESAKGALKAFLLTRSTDIGLYLGAIIMILASGSSIIVGAQADIGLWGGLAFLLAAMGKSAQVPFQSWLTAAMRGPTPVSALLHSATMVAAGVILLLRIFPLLNDRVLLFTGLVGGVTVILTGLSAMSFGDIKKMLAASTASHFGFMLLAIGAGYPGAALLHLISHAFMKSSLFLGAGIFQHSFQSTQFSSLLGTGRKRIFTFVTFAIAGISLAGIPPFVGFWSKDAVLAAAEMSSHHSLFFSLGLVGAVFTGIYMARTLRLLWKGIAEEPESVPRINWMRWGTAVLIVAVVIGGLFIKQTAQLVDWEVPKTQLSMILGVVAALLGLAIGWFLKTSSYLGPAASWASLEFRLAGGYRQIFAQPFLKIAYAFSSFDELLTRKILNTGNAALSLSATTTLLDHYWEKFILGIGKINLTFSHIFSQIDEWGLEASISDFAHSVINFGQRSRKLQSGLVHRELMIAVCGIGVIALSLFLILW